MAKKQNKNLWLWLIGIVIVGIFLGPKLGLFSTLTQETTIVRDGEFETIEDIYDYYNAEYTIICEDFDRFNKVVEGDGPDFQGLKMLILSKTCDEYDVDYIFETYENQNNYCIESLVSESEKPLRESLNIQGISVIKTNMLSLSQNKSYELYSWCEDNDIIGTTFSLELLNAHFGEEDTNGGTTEDKWYNDCLFNYGEEDKCFSILFGLFALGGVLLLMMFMRK